ncbi:MAG: hypothetical protein ACRD00_04525, partial [Thermoanaerobaculia bacterium]
HPRTDPGFGTYPFFEERAGLKAAAAAPEVRFSAQSFLFFAPAYALTLLFILSVAVAERAVFGPSGRQPRGGFRRSFTPVYNVLYLAASGVLLFAGDRLARRYLPDVLVAPVLVAFAPFGAAALAVLPAALLAGPLALLRRIEAA